MLSYNSFHADKDIVYRVPISSLGVKLIARTHLCGLFSERERKRKTNSELLYFYKYTVYAI